jgi:hypothetical protein
VKEAQSHVLESKHSDDSQELSQQEFLKLKKEGSRSSQLSKGKSDQNKHSSKYPKK